MGVNHLNLEQILTFGYCPMQYRLRYVLGLPWFPASAEAAYSLVIRQAIRHYFRMQMSEETFLRGQREALDILYQGVAKGIASFPQSAGRLENLRLEGVLAIHDLKTHFNPKFDSAIGYAIPWSVTSQEKGRQFVVDGTIDALFWKNDGTTSATVVVVTVINTQDPREDLVAWGQARLGFAQKMARDYVICDEKWRFPIRHLAFPAKKRSPLISPEAEHYRYLSIAATQVQEASKVFSMPTTHRARCEHCPYRTVCDVSLAVDSAVERKDELKQGVLELAKGNEFYREGS